jgi:hypothetical protein
MYVEPDLTNCYIVEFGYESVIRVKNPDERTPEQIKQALKEHVATTIHNMSVGELERYLGVSSHVNYGPDTAIVVGVDDYGNGLVEDYGAVEPAL